MRTLFIALSLTLALTASALAAEVKGSVTDRSGGALEGAVVRILNVATGQEVTATADVSGRFRFPNLRAGIYRVAASFTGFSDASRTVVVTDDTQAITLDFELQLGAVQEEVTVSAARGERDEATLPFRTDTISARRDPRNGAGQHGRRPGGCARSVPGRVRTLPGSAAAARSRLDARARARGRRAPEQRAHRHRSRRRRGRPRGRRVDRPRRGPRRRRIGALRHRRALGHDQHHHEPRHGSRTAVSSPRASMASTARTRTAGAARSSSACPTAAGPCRSAAAPSASTTIGRAIASRRARSRSSTRAASISRTRSTTGSASTSTAFRIRSTRRSPGPMREVPNSGMDGSSANLSAIAQLASSQTLEFKYQRRRANDVGFPGLRRAVLLPADHAALEPARQGVGDLLGDESDAVVATPDGYAVLPAAGSAAAQSAAGAVPGAHAPGVLPDQRLPARTSRATRASRCGRPASTCRRRSRWRRATC